MSSSESFEIQDHKYSVFGVGGAGNNILDAMLLRRDTLPEGSVSKIAWDGAFQTYLPMNTNLSEVLETYYAESEDVGNLKQACNFGENPEGAGRDPELGQLHMQNEIEDKNPVQSWPFNKTDIVQAQSVLFIHSMVKGTGTGSTPVLANYIREEILDEEHDEKLNKPMISLAILPRNIEDSSEKDVQVNPAIGFGMMAQNVNAIIPFDNNELSNAANDMSDKVEISGLKKKNFIYEDENKVLVKFIEAFLSSSNPKLLDKKSDMSTGDVSFNDGFDTKDFYQPVERWMPLSRGGLNSPAVVGAPLLAIQDLEVESADDLKSLLTIASDMGVLVDCEPETAWGCNLMFYGPNESLEKINNYKQDGTLTEMWYDVLGKSLPETNIYLSSMPDLDNLYLWGVLFNPKMKRLEEFKSKAEAAKGSRSTGGMFISSHWDEITAVYDILGVENMPDMG